ncbi:MAG: hypothetical protein JWM28_2880 [Chitinophagaceae bacterium]|nr:hypothetical protein [Chitinophagaceae bacterium]
MYKCGWLSGHLVNVKSMKLDATVWLKFALPILICEFPVFVQFQVCF